MAERRPRRPSVAWKEEAEADGALAEGSCELEPHEMFGEQHQLAERTDILLTAIGGMGAPSSGVAQVAAPELVSGDASLLEHVPEVVGHIWRSVQSVSEASARHSLDRALLLSCTYPKEVVVSLLRCSPSCDSAAEAMWGVLVSKPVAARKVLRELLNVLVEWPVHKAVTSDGDDRDVFSLAATMALHEILQPLTCPREVKAFFPQLFLVLLLQTSFTAELTPEEAEMCWRGCQGGECAASSPVRFTVRTLKALLCRAGYESQVLAMVKKGGWDTLLRAETHHRGVGLLAREMRKSSRRLRAFFLRQLSVLLHVEENYQKITAMAFLVELLACLDLRLEDDDVLKLFARHLQSHSQVMRGLVLRGLILLCKRPGMVRKMQVLLPGIMEQLWDADRDVGTKALVVLRNVVHHLGKENVACIAPLLAEMLLPLFDYEPRRVRELSIQLFRDVLEVMVGTRDHRLKKQVHRSLLPLFFHTHDESPSVGQVSLEALLGAAKVLKWEQLRHLAETAQTWRISECLLARGRRGPEHLRQSLMYLESPQEHLREVAVRFTGLLGQRMRGWSKEKLEDICRALQGLQEDISPSISFLATQTILFLQNPRKQSEAGGTPEGLCYRLRRAWERWRSPLCGGCLCCWSSAAS